jgi:putative adenylate-forming enzyme
MIEKIKILNSFFAKRWLLKNLRSREDIEKRQRYLLKTLMAHAHRNIPFYRNFSKTNFNSWPVIDKTIIMQEFSQMNCHGLSRETAWDVAENGLRSTNSSASIGDLTIGTSTGTSGQRGLFLVSSHERALWLGSIFARCLPDFPWTKHRVAVMLATGNDLYKTASASGRLVFRFFDLKQGLECHTRDLQNFDPDVLIAPPKAVRALAEAKARLKLKHIFTGGEVLDPLDANPIEQFFGVRPRSIYQATEGFLGVACDYGHIHLNEDDMLFEEEPIVGHPNHFVLIITDLRRRAQAMIRYRLNDVLVKLHGPCPCGSPLMALQRVEGRCDDVLRFKSALGNCTIQVMPEALRAVILDSDRSVSDFRLVQKTLSILELQLIDGTSQKVVEKIISDLSNYLMKICGLEKIEIGITFGIETVHFQKLRRIRSELGHGH